MCLLAVTHPGKVRNNNEDAFFTDEQAGIAAVADGMGGHTDGEVASAFAVAAVARAAEARHTGTPAHSLSLLGGVPRSVHQEIITYAEKQPGHRLPGTTLTAALLDGAQLHIVHIGDSRAYLWRKGVLSPLTVDHTHVFERGVNVGSMTREQARTHPHSNALSRCIGGSYHPYEPDLLEYTVQPEDRILLTTDGLTDMVSEEHLAHIFRQETDRQGLSGALLSTALAHGGRDNITFILMDFEPAG